MQHEKLDTVSSSHQTSESTPDASKPSDSSIGSSSESVGSNLSGATSGLNFEIQLSSDQLFDFDKYELKPEAIKELEQVYAQLPQKASDVIQVIGYTDSKGNAAYNTKLSFKRAEAVKNWFLERGAKSKFEVIGKGASDPIAPNTHEDGTDNPEGRAQNRRVVLQAAGTASL